jgi:hypothetical protein
VPLSLNPPPSYFHSVAVMYPRSFDADFFPIAPEFGHLPAPGVRDRAPPIPELESCPALNLDSARFRVGVLGPGTGRHRVGVSRSRLSLAAPAPLPIPTRQRREGRRVVPHVARRVWV